MFLTPCRLTGAVLSWMPFFGILVMTYFTLIRTQDGAPLPWYAYLLLGMEAVKVFCFAGHLLLTSMFGVTYPFMEGGRWLHVAAAEMVSIVYSRIRTVVIIVHGIAHFITFPMLLRMNEEREKAKSVGMEVSVTKTLRIFLDELPEDAKQQIGWAATLTYTTVIITLSFVFMRIKRWAVVWNATQGPARVVASAQGCSCGGVFKYLLLVTPFALSLGLTFATFDLLHVEPAVWMIFGVGTLIELIFFAVYVRYFIVRGIVFAESTNGKIMVSLAEGFSLLYTITRSSLLIAILLFRGLTEKFVIEAMPILFSDHRPASEIIKIYWRNVPGKELGLLVAVLITSFLIESVITMLLTTKQYRLFDFSRGVRGQTALAVSGMPHMDMTFEDPASEDEMELLHNDDRSEQSDP